jgi:hypothetical protein
MPSPTEYAIRLARANVALQTIQRIEESRREPGALPEKVLDDIVKWLKELADKNETV